MPMLCSLGQHGALETTQEEIADGENLVAYLDNIWVVSPVQSGSVTCMGLCSAICFSTPGFESMVAKDRFGRGAELDLRDVMRWRGPRRQESPCCGETDLPSSQQGIEVLGTPLGDPAFIQAHLDEKAAEQHTLLERIPMGSAISWADSLALRRSPSLWRRVPGHMTKVFGFACASS